MLWSATGPAAVARTGSALFFVKRQLLNGILPGLVACFVTSRLDYRLWKKFALPALVVSVVLVALTFIPGIGVEINGAKGWMNIGIGTIQPSEFAKLGFLVYLSAWLASREGRQHTVTESLWPFLMALGAVALPIVLQPDTGSVGILAGTALAVYFLSGAPMAWIGGLVASGVAVVALLMQASAYRAARFMAFLHPELDPLGVGYHINQAMLAIGSGGWFGLGYGHSRQKFLYLPEVEADSISAVIAEELGFFAMLVLIAVFGALIWRLFTISRQASDAFGKYLTAGIGAWLAIQLVFHFGSISGMMPMTGVTLPFISHGGSSMVVLLAAMGMASNVAQQGQKRRV